MLFLLGYDEVSLYHEGGDHVVVGKFKVGSVNSWQEFKIEVGNQGRNCEPADCFDEGLPYADALAA